MQDTQMTTCVTEGARRDAASALITKSEEKEKQLEVFLTRS